MCQSCLSDLDVTVREQAFILLSDLLVIFSHRMAQGELSHLQSLVYRPEQSLQAELAGFLVDHVFTEPDDEEDGDEAQKISVLHHRRILLAGYCKLILYNVLQLRSASDIFRHYVKFYTDYGDLIKETLNRSRVINKMESTRTLLLSLTQVYTELCQEGGASPPHRTSRRFLEMRELARRFSLLFGPDQVRNREAIVLLHKEGIKFSFRGSHVPALPSHNLPFLDVLSELSPKLLKQDKRALLQYLDQTSQQCLPPQGEEDLWGPLLAYKRSLSTDSDPTSPNSHVGARRRGEGGKSRPLGPAEPPPSKKRRSKDAAEESIGTMEMGDGPRRPPLLTSTLLIERAPPTHEGRREEEEEEEEGSETDFQPSLSWVGMRRPLWTPSSSHRLRSQASSTATRSNFTPSSGLHRLSLMEEEEEDILIEEEESSEGSAVGEARLPDLLDSAILDSEDDL
ncbi:cohesin subunit SA-3-like isoform X3 [Ascaphus truei]